MQHHSNHSINAQIQAKGMEMDALARHQQQQHVHHRKRSPIRVKLFKFAVLVAIFAAGFWWFSG